MTMIAEVFWRPWPIRLGDFEESDVILNDYVAIQELRKWKGEFALDKPALEEALNILGDEAARHLETALTQAVADHPGRLAWQGAKGNL